MLGRWGTVLGGGGSDNYAAKFLMIGVVYYLIGSFQGSIEVLYSGRYLGKDLSRDNPIPLHFPELLGQNLLCHTGESSS